MEIFPPILTNRASTGVLISSSNVKDIVQNFPTETVTEANRGIEENHQTDVNAAGNKFFFIFPFTEADISNDLSPSMTDHSDYVAEDWSEIEDRENQQRSREAKEAELHDNYWNAFNQLEHGKTESTLSILASMLLNPIMLAFHVRDWSTFEWIAKATSPTKNISNMAKIYFNINLALISFAENPIPFYIQVLSIRPDLKDLWFNCGQAAISWKDWRTAEICMEQCEDEFRSLESLLMVCYLNENFLKCTATLEKLFVLYPLHQLGHIIRELISESNEFWNEYCLKLFGKETPDFQVDSTEKIKLLETINLFRRQTFLPIKDYFAGIIRQPDASNLKWAPLAVKLKLSMKMEDLGELLCDLCDRITQHSSFVEQIVFFELVPDAYSGSLTSGSGEVLDSNIEVEERHQSSGEDRDPSEAGPDSGEERPPDEELRSDDNYLVEKLLGQIVMQENVELERGREENGPISSEILSQDEGTEEQMPLINRTHPKILTKKRPKLTMLPSEVSTEQQDDDLNLRRSLRLVEDLAFSSNSTTIKSSAQLQSNVAMMMGFESEQSASDRHNLPAFSHRHSMPFDPDSIVPEPLPTISDLITFLVNQSQNAVKFPFHLRAYLKWVALKNNNVILSLEQAETFRQVYSRWSSICSDGFSVSSLTISDIAIYQVAAELGSHHALSILQTFYEQLSLIPLIDRICSPASHGEENCEIARDNFCDEETIQTDMNSVDTLDWVFKRIASEQQKRDETRHCLPLE